MTSHFNYQTVNVKASLNKNEEQEISDSGEASIVIRANKPKLSRWTARNSWVMHEMVNTRKLSGMPNITDYLSHMVKFVEHLERHMFSSVVFYDNKYRWESNSQHFHNMLRTLHSKFNSGVEQKLSSIVTAHSRSTLIQQIKHTSGPVFTHRKNGALTPLTCLISTNKLKLSLSQCSIHPTNYSGNSFCQGAMLPQTCDFPGHYTTLNFKAIGIN